MTNYTLVAYRPDHVDTCRGCVMDRTGSDLEISIFRELGAAAEKAAQYEFRENDNDRAYASWEITLLVNGLDESEWWADKTWPTEEKDHFEEFETLRTEAMKAETDRRLEKKRRKEQEAEEGKRREAAASVKAKEEAERAQLRSLLEKYPEEADEA